MTMAVEIIKENDVSIEFSNGDIVEKGTTPMYCRRWFINSRKRREAAVEFDKIHKGTATMVTSWFLNALTKQDAIKEYRSILGDSLDGVKV